MCVRRADGAACMPSVSISNCTKFARVRAAALAAGLHASEPTRGRERASQDTETVPECVADLTQALPFFPFLALYRLLRSFVCVCVCGA